MRKREAKPKFTDSGSIKKLCRIQPRKTIRKREAKSKSTDFDRICKLAEEGKLDLALMRYKFLSAPSSKFNAVKLADAVYRYFYNCWSESRRGKKTVNLRSVRRKAIEILRELAKLHKDVPGITYHIENIRKFSVKPKKRLTTGAKIVRLVGIGLALSIFSSNPDCVCSDQVGKSIGKLAETIRKEAVKIFGDISDSINNLPK